MVRIATFDTFEPLVATASFGLWINMYRIIDAFGWWDKYRITPVARGAKREPASPVWNLFMVQVRWSGETPKGKGREAKCLSLCLPYFEANTTKAAAVYLGILMAFDLMFPRRVYKPFVIPVC